MRHSVESMHKSWSPVSPKANRSPRKTASPTPSSSTTTTGQTSPSAATSTSMGRPTSHICIGDEVKNSPSNRRAYGIDKFSSNFVKRQSLGLNQEAKDPQTQVRPEAITECDARCSLVVNNVVWVGGRDGAITIRRQTDGEVLHIIERRKGAYVLCLLEVGNTVWAGCSDGFIRVLSAMTFKMEKQFGRHSAAGAAVNVLAYHPPSKVVFAGSNDFEILAYSAATYEFVKQMHGHSNAVRTLLVDGNTLYSGSDDRTVAVWDIPTAQKIQQWGGHAKGVHSLCITDNHVWSGDEDATIRIFLITTGECIGVAEVHTGPVSVLTRVGDKVWSGAGNTICIWDASELILLGTYTVHDGYITNILTLNKITHYKLWSFGSDRTIRVWQTECELNESASMKKKIDALHTVDCDNKTLIDKLKIKDAQMADLQAQLVEKQEECNRLLLRMGGMQEQNVHLHDESQQKEFEKTELRQQIKDLQEQVQISENKNTDLQTQVRGLQQQWAEHQTANTIVQEQLSATQRQADILQTQLNESNKKLEEHDTELQTVTKKFQTSELEREQAINDNKQAETDMEQMQSKLREMEFIFKSRLGLITEVFKVYKQFEVMDRKLRDAKPANNTTAALRQDYQTYLSSFKNIIATHFSDDELAHLGSSRYFFPHVDEHNRSPTGKR